jgi:coenzyme F420-dependent glucose-6-phosphate dehydrogenase
MVEIGYTLSSEEFGPRELVGFARRAEEVGFPFALVSDHFHPWTDRQGESPFVWSTIGAVSQATEGLRLGTGVTCPLIRIHPAIVAQAAATSAALMPGRFFLGVGTGENLNEHVLGDRWPPAEQRLKMLEEAIAVLRELWKGETTTFRGDFYTVENARIYTLDEPPPIYVAAAGEKAAELAGRVGDGLISVAPDGDVVRAFEKAGGKGKSKYGQLHVCVADDEEQAKATAIEVWPLPGIKGELGQELPLPRHFEQAAEMVEADDLTESVTMGPDPARHVEAIGEYVDAGFDHVYVHQIGDDQERLFDLYQREVLPELARRARAA